MILYREGWYYLTIKKLSELLRGLTRNKNSDFYCLNCPYSFKTRYTFESHKYKCEKKDFCHVVMPSEETKMLEFNQY